MACTYLWNNDLPLGSSGKKSTHPGWSAIMEEPCLRRLHTVRTNHKDYVTLYGTPNETIIKTPIIELVMIGYQFSNDGFSMSLSMIDYRMIIELQ